MEQKEPALLSWHSFSTTFGLSAYTDDGKTLLQGMYKNGVEHFNPYASPYSYNVSIALNGAIQNLPQKPFIIQGTTYVPLRGLFGSMNLNVYWDDYSAASNRTQMITATQNSTIMQFSRTDGGKGFGSWKLLKWESEYPDTADSPVNTFDIREIQPVIIDGATYVPLRIVSEGFGAQVNWNDTSKQLKSQLQPPAIQRKPLKMRPLYRLILLHKQIVSQSSTPVCRALISPHITHIQIKVF